MGGFQISVPKIAGPVDQLTKVQGYSNLRNAGRLQEQGIQQNEMDMQAEQAAAQQKQQEQKAIQQALVESNYSMTEALPKLQGRVSQPTYEALTKSDLDIRTKRASLTKSEREEEEAKNSEILKLVDSVQKLPPDQYAASWPQVVAAAKRINPKADIPAEPVPQDQLEPIRIHLMTNAQYEAEQKAKDAETKAAAALKHADEQADLQRNSPGETLKNYYEAKKNGFKGTLLDFERAEAEAKRDPRAAAGDTITVNTIDANGKPVTKIVPKVAGAEYPQGAANKQATGVQRAYFDYFQRMQKSIKDGEAVENKIIGKGTVGAAWEKSMPNFLKSEEGQLYRNAIERFILAKLRKESGAAISESEFKKEAEANWGQPGDTPAMVAQKKRARQDLLEGYASQAGPAWTEYFGEQFEPGSFSKIEGTGQGKSKSYKVGDPITQGGETYKVTKVDANGKVLDAE